MKKLFFPINLGSGNRGCEAIIEGTYQILNFSSKNTFIYDSNNEEKNLDCLFGVNKIGKVIVRNSDNSYGIFTVFFHKVLRKLRISDRWFYTAVYKTFLDSIDEDSVIFFTGGDLYCYSKMANMNTDLHKKCRFKKSKTILWGASISNEFLNKRTVSELKEYTRIICRESLSFDTLMKAGVSDNVFLYPDPAFTLRPEPIQLPICFCKEVIGINISNFVNGDYSLDSLFGKNICNLVDYIIANTELNILLIPHVTWKGQDDRIICKKLYEKYNNCGRVFLLNIDYLSYCKIRYIISKCRFFIGARTHSVISAYCTQVPTLALGYSIKSIGIAHDIGLDEQLVVDCKHLQNENELIDRFKYLCDNKYQIKNHLSKVMPGYIQKAYQAKEAVYNLIQ